MGRNSQVQFLISFWICLALIGRAPAVAEANSLFPSNSVVVLLAGLPGDVESETAYSEQLRAWLDLVARSGSVRKLLVLCDAPESITTPSIIETKVLKGDRQNFLSMGEALGGDRKPLTVIAWGHGGKQGSTPVLHVRGPRLTPGDFRALADQRGEVESRWILLFRGSGSFAHELAGKNRQILTSDHDSMFGSDPIAMVPFLKVVRNGSGMSFAKLAEEFGRATASWYVERNLARTEEPTLWVGNDKPRLLATEAGENSLASTVAEQPVEKTPVSEQNELPLAWKEIKRVEPRQFPDSDGVILQRKVSYTLGSVPAIASEEEEFIQILTPEGKRFGDFDISYSPPFEEIEFLDCEVLRPDGKVVRLDPDAIREEREQSAGDYKSERHKFFSLPGIVPRAVLRVRHRSEWKKFPLPHVSLEIPIGLEAPVVDGMVQVSLPKETPFHFALEHLSARDPEVSHTTYGATYTWHFEKLPARGRDVLISPGRAPRLLISTFPDWTAFADWYGRIIQLADEVTPEIAAKALELTRDAKSERAKVLALYNYVTSLRYVAVPLGINSVRPHAAANVLRNQFGDCKDKANLFNTLLHSLKIEASLVLVPRFGQAHEAIPALAFNHAISRVRLGNEFMWVDTTDDVCRFGMLPPGDSGRKVLVIDGHSSALTRLPESDPKEHRLQLRGRVDCTQPAGSLRTSLSATAMGYPDYELRVAARGAKEHRASVPLLAAGFRPVVGSFALDNQTTTQISALDENFCWRAEGVSIGVCSVAADRGALRAPFWLPREWDLALHHRKLPLFLNQGYPLALEEEFEFVLPAKSQPVSVPGVNENTTQPLQWRIEWAKLGDGKLAARFRAELERGELSEEETARFQRQLRELLAALVASADLSLPP